MAADARRIEVVLLEDDASDAELIQLELSREYPNARWRHAVSQTEFVAAIATAPDLVLADYSLPGFDGLTALSLLRSSHPWVPFIFVSGSLGEERATEALKSGATDYVLKDRLPRLPGVVHRALAEANERQERRLAQAALEAQRVLLSTLIDNLPDMVFATDIDGRLTVVNRALLRFFGRTRTAVVGHRLGEFPDLVRLVHGESSGPVSLQPERTVHDQEVTHMTPSGALRWFSTSRLPLRDATTGTVVGTVCTIRDVTAYRELARELADISNREQQRLGSDLHDGLGQELTGLSLLLRGLEVQLAQEAPLYLPQVIKIRELLTQTIQSTRLLAMGLAPVNLERGGLPEALRKLAQRCTNVYGLECTFEFANPTLPKLDEGAATHLFRIAQEATTNAARYAQASHINLSLDIAGKRLKLVVADDGIGLTAGLEGGSVGMGLKIMEYRAKLMGATLVIDEPGAGTRIVLTCPLRLLVRGPEPIGKTGSH